MGIGVPRRKLYSEEKEGVSDCGWREGEGEKKRGREEGRKEKREEGEERGGELGRGAREGTYRLSRVCRIAKTERSTGQWDAQKVGGEPLGVVMVWWWWPWWWWPGVGSTREPRTRRFGPCRSHPRPPSATEPHPHTPVLDSFEIALRVVFPLLLLCGVLSEFIFHDHCPHRYQVVTTYVQFKA